MANLGISFSPFGDPNSPQPQGGGQQGGAISPQEAIRVLSLRIPRAVGAGAPTPLLPGGPGAGGAAFGGGANLEQLLALLFGRPGMPSTEPMNARDLFAPPTQMNYARPPGYHPPIPDPTEPMPPTPPKAPRPTVGFGEPEDTQQAQPPAPYTPPSIERLGRQGRQA